MLDCGREYSTFMQIRTSSEQGALLCQRCSTDLVFYWAFLHQILRLCIGVLFLIVILSSWIAIALTFEECTINSAEHTGTLRRRLVEALQCLKLVSKTPLLLLCMTDLASRLLGSGNAIILTGVMRF